MYSSSVLDLIVFTKELLFVFQPSSFCDFGGLCFVFVCLWLFSACFIYKFNFYVQLVSGFKEKTPCSIVISRKNSNLGSLSLKKN